MVTLLADALGVQVTRDCLKVPGGYLYDKHFLQRAQFLEFEHGNSSSVRYLIRGQAPLPLPPNPAALFDIQDGVSTQQLRNLLLQRMVEEIQDDDDDNEEEENVERNEEEEEQQVGGHEGGVSEPWRAYVDERLQERWAIEDQRWNSVQERWALEDQRWAQQDQRWAEMMHLLQNLNTRDPGAGPGPSGQ